MAGTRTAEKKKRIALKVRKTTTQVKTRGHKELAEPAVKSGYAPVNGLDMFSEIHGGFGAKVHVRVEGRLRLMTFELTRGQRNEAVVLPALLEQGEI